MIKDIKLASLFNKAFLEMEKTLKLTESQGEQAAKNLLMIEIKSKKTGKMTKKMEKNYDEWRDFLITMILGEYKFKKFREAFERLLIRYKHEGKEKLINIAHDFSLYWTYKNRIFDVILKGSNEEEIDEKYKTEQIGIEEIENNFKKLLGKDWDKKMSKKDFKKARIEYAQSALMKLYVEKKLPKKLKEMIEKSILGDEFFETLKA